MLIHNINCREGTGLIFSQYILVKCIGVGGDRGKRWRNFENFINPKVKKRKREQQKKVIKRKQIYSRLSHK